MRLLQCQDERHQGDDATLLPDSDEKTREHQEFGAKSVISAFSREAKQTKKQ
jgi:hypothetical protein